MCRQCADVWKEWRSDRGRRRPVGVENATNDRRCHPINGTAIEELGRTKIHPGNIFPKVMNSHGYDKKAPNSNQTTSAGHTTR